MGRRGGPRANREREKEGEEREGEGRKGEMTKGEYIYTQFPFPFQLSFGGPARGRGNFPQSGKDKNRYWVHDYTYTYTSP